MLETEVRLALYSEPRLGRRWQGADVLKGDLRTQTECPSKGSKTRIKLCFSDSEASSKPLMMLEDGQKNERVTQKCEDKRKGELKVLFGVGMIPAGSDRHGDEAVKATFSTSLAHLVGT